ncbi:MAG: antitermination protein NusG, partial [Verrucomicrobia bacterium]
MQPPSSPPEGPVWVVAHTMPRCEKKFADVVLRDRFEYELPLVTSVRRYRNRTRRFTKPLFPGYVFV